MTSRLALWLALRIVRVVAVLVPAALRTDWWREWDAELRHHMAHLQGRRNLTWRTSMDLIRRALGALPDAAWMRRQFTLDADAVHDAAYGVRMLFRTPGFTAITLLVFAIGIGATTAIVSVADALFIRQLPVWQPERVMTLWQYHKESGESHQEVAPGNAMDWMTTARSFEALAMAEPWTLNSTINGREPEHLAAARVSEQFFAVLDTVTNLLLARGVARGREFAVRHALGANRIRLVRQMLVESLLLATMGGAVGLALARWTLDLVARFRPPDVARVDQIPIDARAAVIAFGVTLLAAIIAGLTPSIQLSRPTAANALKEGRTSSRRGLRSALVVVEVAAALVLAVGAGLLVRSFIAIQRVDPGFNRDHVVTLQLFASPRIDTAQKRIVFFYQALNRMHALPGVVAAGGVSAMPFGEAKVIARAALAINGRPAASGEESLVYTTTVAGDYFRAMGIPLLEGRTFDATDTAVSRQVVLVSRTAAQRFWPGSDPIGSRVRFRFSGMSYDAEVIGVVSDVQHEALDRPPAPELFIPYAQSGFRALTLVIRTAPGSPTTLQAMKEQIWALDPQQSIYHAAPLDRLVSRTLVNRRFILLLLGGFALATLLLATAGVYGVMSFSTSQRTREFGVRLALGAKRRDIMGLVLGEALKLAGIGVIIGFAVAVPLTRTLGALLYGVAATDAVTFVTVAVGLILVAAAACYVPARRALRVHPAEALRFD